jgi:hypothetical protein
MYDAHSLGSTDQVSRSRCSIRCPNYELVSNIATANLLNSKLGGEYVRGAHENVLGLGRTVPRCNPVRLGAIRGWRRFPPRGVSMDDLRWIVNRRARVEPFFSEPLPKGC